VAIIGAGVLGVTIAFWLSSLSNRAVALLDKEERVAAQTSSRNTGVIHRPFYLHPEKKRILAHAAQKSYYYWAELARKYSLSWSEVGTLEVAVEDSQLNELRQYKEWALKNGMEESEVQLLTGSEVEKMEPLVQCAGAIHSKRDTAVSYGDLTNSVSQLAQKNGVEFLGGLEVMRVNENSSGVTLNLRKKSGETTNISCSFVINAAGGNSMDIAHQLELAKNCTDLHFRGEYWVVDPAFGEKISKNIYSVAKHKEFPFLDPHFIVRASGRREVGPNAVLVSGPNVYQGLSESKAQFLKKIFERPNRPKLRLFTNTQFLSLVWQEWRSSISRKAMCDRVKRFIPSLDVERLQERGLSGVRSSVIDDKGFVPEAIILEDRNSLHILNYNSPGATGAPAYSAYVVKRIFDAGYVPKNSSSKNDSSTDISWDFETAAAL
jgi:(S)-2-hydroxyglutarate dehydrogenase